MITGQVNSKLEAVIPLTAHGPQGQTRTLEAVIDTGYSGFLTLPSAVIAALGLSHIATGHLTLADGGEIVSDLYLATVVWDGQERATEVDTLEAEVLVGMGLLKGYDLHARIAIGGQVTITNFQPTTG
ncbi:MAG: clan AA aspartic protease [Blastocatellia bacterium]